MSMPRVLVVDDQPELRLLISLTLAGESLELREAANGADALATCKDWRPHLVLLDVMMPGMNGYEVCRQIKSDASLNGTIVVLLTAADQASNRQHGLECGADQYFSKPFSPELLRQLVVGLSGKLAG